MRLVRLSLADKLAQLAWRHLPKWHLRLEEARLIENALWAHIASDLMLVRHHLMLIAKHKWLLGERHIVRMLHAHILVAVKLALVLDTEWRCWMLVMLVLLSTH